jgi:hypothetical protein
MKGVEKDSFLSLSSVISFILGAKRWRYAFGSVVSLIYEQ